MTLDFLSGSRNFCKLLWVSCEVLVLHGYDWIHWVAKSCTTTAYRWVFRDSQFSLRTLWPTVIKSPKFSARGTAPRLRLLHGALVILVLLQISQFRSLGNEFQHCDYLNPHVSWIWALKKLHEKTWRESLRVLEFHHPPNFRWILAATPGFQNLRDLSRQTTCVSVLSWSPFCFLRICGWLGKLARDWIHGRQRVSPFYHQHWNLTQALERYHFQFDPLSLPSLLITWCCFRWWRRRAWRRCTWRCHWSWMIRNQRKNSLTSLEPRSERSSPCCIVFETRVLMRCCF